VPKFYKTNQFCRVRLIKRLLYFQIQFEFFSVFFFSFLSVLLILLVIHQVTFARQLGCTYQNQHAGIWSYWPAHKECYLSYVDLSSSYKLGGHSISGSSRDKSGVSLVRFEKSNVIEFIPTELSQEFSKLNALVIQNSNLPVVKTGLFRREFKNLGFLAFWDSKVQAIETNAFADLENLKHFWIYGSPLKTLHFGLFRNNLKLEIVRLYSNEISMIHSALFDDLTHLKLLQFSNNVCVSKTFGCETCTVSQSELKSGLTTCFANCRADPECFTLTQEISESTRTIKSEITSSIAQIDKKLTNLESTCEAISKRQSTEIEKVSQKATQVEKNLSLFIAKESNFMADLQSLTTKNFEAQNFVIGNATKALKDSNDLTMSDFKALFQDQVQKCEESNNETAESLNENLAGKIDAALESMKTANDDLKASVENSSKETREYLDSKMDTAINSLDSKVDSVIKSIDESNQKLLETLHETILKATDARVELLESKLELEKTKHALEKKELEERFKQQMADFVQKKLEEFEMKLREEHRP
jgi:hypothetical protein